MNVVDVVDYSVMNIFTDTQIVQRENELEKSTEDIMREIINAKDNAIERAGMVQVSDIGDSEIEKKQATPIHQYDDEKECKCKCHPNKLECMECYDHPTHLSKNLQKND